MPGYIRSTGGRGRQGEISGEEATRFLDRLDRVARNLQSQREASHGFRDPRVLGEQGGSLPGWLEYARTLAMAAEGGAQIELSRAEYKDLQAAMKMARSLSATQETYRERALVRLEEQDYFKGEHEAREALSSDLAVRKLDELRRQYERLSEKERAAFFRSRRYQDIRSAFKLIRREKTSYKRAREWVKRKMKERGEWQKNMRLTDSEALLYIIADKAGGEDVGL